jgi:hypothetical protein
MQTTDLGALRKTQVIAASAHAMGELYRVPYFVSGKGGARSSRHLPEVQFKNGSAVGLLQPEAADSGSCNHE